MGDVIAATTWSGTGPEGDLHAYSGGSLNGTNGRCNYLYGMVE